VKFHPLFGSVAQFPRLSKHLANLEFVSPILCSSHPLALPTPQRKPSRPGFSLVFPFGRETSDPAKCRTASRDISAGQALASRREMKAVFVLAGVRFYNEKPYYRLSPNQVKLISYILFLCHDAVLSFSLQGGSGFQPPSPDAASDQLVGLPSTPSPPHFPQSLKEFKKKSFCDPGQISSAVDIILVKGRFPAPVHRLPR